MLPTHTPASDRSSSPSARSTHQVRHRGDENEFSAPGHNSEIISIALENVPSDEFFLLDPRQVGPKLSRPKAMRGTMGLTTPSPLHSQRLRRPTAFKLEKTITNTSNPLAVPSSITTRTQIPAPQPFRGAMDSLGTNTESSSHFDHIQHRATDFCTCACTFRTIEQQTSNKEDQAFPAREHSTRWSSRLGLRPKPLKATDKLDFLELDNGTDYI